MTAFGINDQVALIFTTVLNELSRGVEDEDDEPQEAVDQRTGREGLEGRPLASQIGY